MFVFDLSYPILVSMPNFSSISLQISLWFSVFVSITPHNYVIAKPTVPWRSQSLYFSFLPSSSPKSNNSGYPLNTFCYTDLVKCSRAPDHLSACLKINNHSDLRLVQSSIYDMFYIEWIILILPDLSYLLPTMLSNRGVFSGPPTNS